jgi:uncharacterized protein (TIGR02145 family)
MRKASFLLILIFVSGFMFFGCDKKSPTDNEIIPTDPETVTDIDGNIYQTAKIGNQIWIAENLKVTKYRNGDPIPNVTDSSEWVNLTTGAYCTFDNDESNVTTYGLLYNWFAVKDSRNIAPEGWHVPMDEEWKTLEMYLGMSQSEADDINLRGTNEGSKLKSSSAWVFGGNGTNESGFSAVQGSYRFDTGRFGALYAYAAFWSSTEADSDSAWHRGLGYTYSKVNRIVRNKNYGYSIRLVCD